MNDPTAAISAPPPRYLLESDSSDEEGQGEYAASSSRRAERAKATQEVRVDWEDAEAQKGLKEVVIGVGQSGRYLRRKIDSKGSEKAAVKLTLGEEEVGRGWAMDGVLLMALEEAEGDEAWRIVEKVTGEVKAERWSVLSSECHRTLGMTVDRLERQADPAGPSSLLMYPPCTSQIPSAIVSLRRSRPSATLPRHRRARGLRG
jgi:hypothetical protein